MHTGLTSEHIYSLFSGHLRTNRVTKEVEVFDEYGVKMRIPADDTLLDEIDSNLE